MKTYRELLEGKSIDLGRAMDNLNQHIMDIKGTDSKEENAIFTALATSLDKLDPKNVDEKAIARAMKDPKVKKAVAKYQSDVDDFDIKDVLKIALK